MMQYALQIMQCILLNSHTVILFLCQNRNAAVTPHAILLLFFVFSSSSLYPNFAIIPTSVTHPPLALRYRLKKKVYQHFLDLIGAILRNVDTVYLWYIIQSVLIVCHYATFIRHKIPAKYQCLSPAIISKNV
jgi:hypothetical protein